MKSNPKTDWGEDMRVKMARNRFKNALVKHMLQENYFQEERIYNSDTEDRAENRRSGQCSTSNRKVNSFSGLPKQQGPSFMMKLFDRGIDLAKFDQNTPLYTICRAWLNSRPNDNNKSPEEENDLEASNDSRCGTDEFYRLPPPKSLPYDENGNQMSIRIPSPLPPPTDDITYSADDSPSPALLFENHLDRWNLIRQRWMQAGARNERRYESSFAILREIHDASRQNNN